VPGAVDEDEGPGRGCAGDGCPAGGCRGQSRADKKRSTSHTNPPFLRIVVVGLAVNGWCDGAQALAGRPPRHALHCTVFTDGAPLHSSRRRLDATGDGQ